MNTLHNKSLKTSKKPVYYIGLLGNVDRTILNLNLGGDFFVQEREKIDVLKLLSQLLCHSEIDIDCGIEDKFHYSNEEKYVYILHKEHHCWPFDAPDGSSVEDFVNIHHQMDLYEESIKNRIGLLRLFAEGDVSLPISCYYRLENGSPDLVSATERERVLEADNRFSIPDSEWTEVNRFIRTKYDALLERYLQLAYRQFDLSYEVNDEQMAFLSLNIALEILFNDGKQDIGYKISRGTAALIGKTKNEALAVYARMKKLYGKRSALVHSGDAKITGEDIHEMRDYTRQCLRKLFSANTPKDVLSERLTVSGFGRIALPKKK